MTLTTDFIDTTVTNGDVRLAVRDYPGGPGIPLVLIHGGGRNLADWDLVLPDLVPHHRVVTFDARGHGQTTPVDNWLLADAVADTEAVIAHLGLDDPIVGGHSMGGMISTLYGEIHPGCRGIVNVDGSGVDIPPVMPGVEDGPARLLALIDIEAKKGLEAAPETPTGDAAWVEAQLAEYRAAIEAAGLDWSILAETARRSYLPIGDGQFQVNPAPRMWANAYEDIRQMKTFSILRRLECPVLYIRGAREDQDETTESTDVTGEPNNPDPELLRAHALGSAMELESIAAANPRFRLEVADSGHMVNLERPHELAAWLLDFARDLA